MLQARNEGEFNTNTESSNPVFYHLNPFLNLWDRYVVPELKSIKNTPDLTMSPVLVFYAMFSDINNNNINSGLFDYLWLADNVSQRLSFKPLSYGDPLIYPQYFGYISKGYSRNQGRVYSYRVEKPGVSDVFQCQAILPTDNNLIIKLQASGSCDFEVAFAVEGRQKIYSEFRGEPLTAGEAEKLRRATEVDYHHLLPSYNPAPGSYADVVWTY